MSKRKQQPKKDLDDPKEKWSCSSCATENKPQSSNCRVCGTHKPVKKDVLRHYEPSARKAGKETNLGKNKFDQETKVWDWYKEKENDDPNFKPSHVYVLHLQRLIFPDFSIIPLLSSLVFFHLEVSPRKRLIQFSSLVFSFHTTLFNFFFFSCKWNWVYCQYVRIFISNFFH